MQAGKILLQIKQEYEQKPTTVDVWENNVHKDAD
jgi:hypothetical protein